MRNRDDLRLTAHLPRRQARCKPALIGPDFGKDRGRRHARYARDAIQKRNQLAKALFTLTVAAYPKAARRQHMLDAGLCGKGGVGRLRRR